MYLNNNRNYTCYLITDFILIHIMYFNILNGFDYKNLNLLCSLLMLIAYMMNVSVYLCIQSGIQKEERTSTFQINNKAVYMISIMRVFSVLIHIALGFLQINYIGLVFCIVYLFGMYVCVRRLYNNHTKYLNFYIPSFTHITQIDTSTECAICLDNLTEKTNPLGMIPHSCKGVFHKKCLHKWLTQHTTCPYCREIIV